MRVERVGVVPAVAVVVAVAVAVVVVVAVVVAVAAGFDVSPSSTGPILSQWRY